MSEENVKAVAKKAAKKAAKKVVKKAAPKAAAKGGLSGNQLKILVALVKSKDGLSRQEIKDTTGITNGLSKLLGAFGESATLGEGTLGGLGLAKAESREERRGMIFVATAAGRKAAAAK